MDVTSLVDYIREKQMHVRIEIEARPDVIRRFVSNHNSRYGCSITENSSGIIKLKPDADKWGVEQRVYFTGNEDFPTDFSSLLRGNNTYHSDLYPYRINHVGVVTGLFDNGFVVGDN